MLGTVYYTLEPIAWLSSIGIFLGFPISIFVIKKGLNHQKTSQFIPLILNSQSLILFLPFLWTFFDHLAARYSLLPGYIITAGNIFGSSPFLGLATIDGLMFLTFFATLINVLIAVFILKIKSLNSSAEGGSASRRRRGSPLAASGKSSILNPLIIVIIVLAGWQISNSQLQKNAINYNNLKNSIKIAVISANEKFNWLSFNEIKNKLNGEKIDFIIFPEDIFNNNIINSEKVYQDLAKNLDVDLVAAFDTIQNNKKYNSTVLFNNKGEIIDARGKNRLTFAGEYWPFGNWRLFYFDWLAKDRPTIKNYAVFNPQSQYSRGEKNLLTIQQFNNGTILFASPICSEIQYQNDLKEYKKNGAKFIVNPASNRWIEIGTKHFLYLNNNLKKIEAVWLKTPIISSGVKDFAGITTPDGKTDLVDGIFFGEIRY